MESIKLPDGSEMFRTLVKEGLAVFEEIPSATSETDRGTNQLSVDDVSTKQKSLDSAEPQEENEGLEVISDVAIGGLNNPELSITAQVILVLYLRNLS